MTNEQNDLESIASESVGKIIFALSQLEFNLNLCFQWLIRAEDFHTVNPLVERLSFKSKIDALNEIIEIKFPSSPECISDFRLWSQKLDKSRVKRNSFMHGRWAFQYGDQAIINVAPGMIGTKRLKETRYSVDELEAELLLIKAISKEFISIREKWQI
ncbi:hypothetical protein [Methylophaga nitratireducenticrescens]|uniref:hypothetical protein n=1 Tax=Methylophaga nitratireducenticrescens TaxID=754476 RepID=UPI000CDC69F5|nr:hypothetical protein [Methylophaga nitratireducenticrescens]AUZ85222.1 hypothetical protein CDW43_11860 [Methylophaga nitratireducenticrescens]